MDLNTREVKSSQSTATTEKYANSSFLNAGFRTSRPVPPSTNGRGPATVIFRVSIACWAFPRWFSSSSILKPIVAF